MAKDSKKKAFPKATTPKGVFVYPKLSEPDYGTKDFPKPDGEYSVRLKMSRTDADAFADAPLFVVDGSKDRKTLNELYAEAEANGQAEFAKLDVKSRKAFEKKQITGPVMNPLFEIGYDEETEEETGEVTFKFTKRASGVFKAGPKQGKKWSSKVALFDAKGKPMAGVLPNIWGGTEGKVSFAVGNPYFIPSSALTGIKLMLEAVQIIDLVSDGSRSASSYGFGEEEGFGYDESEFKEEEAKPETSGDSDSTKAGEDDF